MNQKRKYNPQKHNRKSIRLKGYDYSQPGMYFVTICCQDKKHLFGEIIDGEMFMNDAGKMIEKWYLALSNKFQNVECGDYVVMPDHFHAVVIILDENNSDENNSDERNLDEHNSDERNSDERNLDERNSDEHVGSSLPEIIQWFKTMTTNEYIRGVKQLGWQPFHRKIWQRNYYEHIIRNETSCINIKKYINDNPKNWNIDKQRKK